MKKLFTVLLLTVFAYSCTEKINIKLDPNFARLVVDGSISTDTSAFTINLTQTADYFYNAPIPRVNGATVTLSDGTNTVPLTETLPGISGIYQTGSTFHGTIGNVYTLNVSLSQPIAGGSSYSASSRLPDVPKLDSIHIELHPELGRHGDWLILLFAQEPGNEVNYYMFHWYRNRVLMTDSIEKVVISDDKYFNGSYINGLTAIRIGADNTWETPRPGDTITLQMSGITKEYYNFISEVQSAGFNIPFFEGPPANVVGNINNNAVGFFAAFSNSYARTVVK
jgi:hypothetical protein